MIGGQPDMTVVGQVAEGLARYPVRWSRTLSMAQTIETIRHVCDDVLSEREIQVLRCVAAGKSNKLIAVELGITEDTVKTHMKSILPKLDASDRTHAVMIALRRGILDI